MSTMKYTAEPDGTFVAPRVVPVSRGRIVVNWLTSTDHKTIGYMYLIASFVFFSLAGVMALLIRAELFEPGMQILQTREQYNQLFTMHGTAMLLMFATPLFAGFANVIMPLQIGAPDVAFPRLNALAFWFFLFGSLIALSGFITPQGTASFGWTAYTPLSNVAFSPGLGGDLWVFGLALSGFGTILGSVNFITTIICLRAPGMTMWRMPIFTWNTLVTAILVLMAFPPLAAALFALGADRRFGADIYNPERGGSILWQHLFWFFGHPEVYIIALPFFGIVSEIFPVFSRKSIFGYKGLVFATISIAALSVTVWAHHMYVTGAVMLPFFSFMTMLIAVPTGVKFFNWIGTLWRGSITFETPMLWSIGFLITFLFGGLTGIILSSPPLDFHVSDTYFVVAHFHYVVFGTVVFAMFAGFYFWWPKFTGKMLNERLGKIHFWLLFLGFHTTFLIQHWLGVLGMPRRYADYLVEDNFTGMNQLSTIGSAILALSMIPFIWNVYATWRHGKKVEVDDPWGFGGSLEWATSCPPPRHNFTSLPKIRSERPALDLHHPELMARANSDTDSPAEKLFGAADMGSEEPRNPDPRQ
ncbi:MULTISPECIES: cytochrome c oxidase subunit I [unclassified Arthrobacter]|uniref:aa3-type cytochrome oxidase subunit I n=1 Tax=unclassified Arthrobacter TaxID=235627 RepID=UPI001E4C2E90|nr:MULTISPECIES: cytochrome c oxidase subunit I [unclassified Arthrobacter]MCC9144438.1 cytochrome c oxidase subunit I [Arthrobacter sp. zg-Y919]MDK1275664.1 cytochrome c oxidase subunit I [Arthrobacter sp. zg.Y919]MDM7991296.1 cytochrome c oxidase subunit I [Arthrobacter sp. zg-Y877]WIB02968.1 cytochrome c oxidase subunit I [Arthrobacter sp. zg-Y919]